MAKQQERGVTIKQKKKYFKSVLEKENIHFSVSPISNNISAIKKIAAENVQQQQTGNPETDWARLITIPLQFSFYK